MCRISTAHCFPARDEVWAAKLAAPVQFEETGTKQERTKIPSTPFSSSDGVRELWYTKVCCIKSAHRVVDVGVGGIPRQYVGGTSPVHHPDPTCDTQTF